MTQKEKRGEDARKTGNSSEAKRTTFGAAK